MAISQLGKQRTTQVHRSQEFQNLLRCEVHTIFHVNTWHPILNLIYYTENMYQASLWIVHTIQTENNPDFFQCQQSPPHCVTLVCAWHTNSDTLRVRSNTNWRMGSLSRASLNTAKTSPPFPKAELLWSQSRKVITNSWTILSRNARFYVHLSTS